MTHEAKNANYLIFALLDIEESLLAFLEAEFAKDEVRLRPRQKTLFNSLKYTVRDLRSTTTAISIESQEEFGIFSDNIKELLLLTIDRCGENDKKFQLVNNFIKSMNSELNLKLKKFGIDE